MLKSLEEGSALRGVDATPHARQVLSRHSWGMLSGYLGSILLRCIEC